MEADEVEAAEADAAEAGELDENETTVDDETEVEDSAAISEADLKRAERAIEAHQRKIGGILGDDMVAHECLLCQGLGFVPAVPEPGSFAVVVDDGGPVLQWSQPGEPPPFLSVAPDKERCPECDGYGETVTGSRSPHALTAPCGKCSGNGWVIKARDAQPFVLPPSNTSTISAAPQPQTPQVPDDAWGRPYGHPHYGIPPSMVGS